MTPSLNTIRNPPATWIHCSLVLPGYGMIYVDEQTTSKISLVPFNKTLRIMAQDNDAERQGLHEATPLLQERPRSSSTSSPSEDDGKTTRAISWYAWRIFLLLAALLVTGVFVKGWLDAGADRNFDLGKALWKALGGGLSGAAAMVLQVLLLMPLRTIMNYQYRFGTSFTTATKTLYQDGGLLRYYQGMAAALFQGPLSRFGDTAANAGILALLQSNSYLKDLPSPIKTIFASLCAACFRMILTPIDTLKTTLQVQGSRGTTLLRQRIKNDGVGSLWWGAIATAAATFVGHYPWFATNNFLSDVIKEPPKQELLKYLLRLALIGFMASIVSDSVSNSLRVVKTYRQVNDTKVSYSQAARNVIREDGVLGLLGRGLKTRILANGLQGLLFKILWELLLDLWDEKTKS
ncbi:mitochondrial carrier domain-containing protein [Amylocarpus encephaloides]|uniref:Mitochondrial carrier domain-containing protein n=1 Tax=Amylocarpus encephaloides TaxID=45428 RepID=A0A9P7YL60_9HELO|nr:mitochondrial carrier domain-containing protein [Amylocarpus encephaloides]